MAALNKNLSGWFILLLGMQILLNMFVIFEDFSPNLNAHAPRGIGMIAILYPVNIFVLLLTFVYSSMSMSGDWRPFRIGLYASLPSVLALPILRLIYA